MVFWLARGMAGTFEGFTEGVSSFIFLVLSFQKVAIFPELCCLLRASRWPFFLTGIGPRTTFGQNLALGAGK